MEFIKYKLDYLRAAKNLTQQELADRLGVTQQAVCRWEVGKSKPSLATVAEIADILDCDFLTVAKCFVEIKR